MTPEQYQKQIATRAAMRTLDAVDDHAQSWPADVTRAVHVITLRLRHQITPTTGRPA